MYVNHVGIFTSERMQIDVSKEYSLNVVLESGTVQKSITVVAGADVVNCSSGELKTAIELAIYDGKVRVAWKGRSICSQRMYGLRSMGGKLLSLSFERLTLLGKSGDVCAIHRSGVGCSARLCAYDVSHR